MEPVLRLLQAVVIGVFRLVTVVALVITVCVSLDICDVVTRDGRVPATTFASVATRLWDADVNRLMVCRWKIGKSVSR